MGPPEQAPQASIRGSADTVGNYNVLKLEHQGGEAITLTDSKTKVTFDGSPVDFEYLAGGETQFDAGESLYIYNYDDGTYYLSAKANVTTNTNDVDTNIAAIGTTSNVKIVDVGSQQMIADLKVNF